MRRKLKLNMTAIDRVMKFKTAMSARFGCLAISLEGKQGTFKDKYGVYNNIVLFYEHHTKSLSLFFLSQVVFF